ncbi:hypothetical protein FXO37_26154 [Capsicum annuum]|nr:hypothetical protein FXO37_26154 [Capsicum annuum]
MTDMYVWYVDTDRNDELIKLASTPDGSRFDSLVSGFQWDKDMINYVREKRPYPHDKDWTKAKMILVVMNMEKKYFLAVEILLEEAMMKENNRSSNHTRKENQGWNQGLIGKTNAIQGKNQEDKAAYGNRLTTREAKIPWPTIKYLDQSYKMDIYQIDLYISMDNITLTERKVLESSLSPMTSKPAELKSMGMVYPNGLQVRILLKRLPKAWETKATILEDRDLNKMMYDELRGNLMAYEQNHMKRHAKEDKRKSVAFNVSNYEDEEHKVKKDNEVRISIALISQIEPKRIGEALNNESWIKAMQEELDQFERIQVWSLVQRHKNISMIGTKWVFRNKMNKEGNVGWNKTRLVAQGYSQQEGFDTFAPVMRKLTDFKCLVSDYLDFQKFHLIFSHCDNEMVEIPVKMVFAILRMSKDNSELETLVLGNRIVVRKYIFEKLFDKKFFGSIPFFSGSWPEDFDVSLEKEKQVIAEEGSNPNYLRPSTMNFEYLILACGHFTAAT